MSVITEEMKAKAQMCFGDEDGKEKCQLLLKEVGLPNGLLPLKDIVECGYVEENGFVWLKMKKKMEQKFEKIGKLVQYAPEVTAYVERGRIKKLTGVKAKELVIWIAVSDIYIKESSPDKITFQAPTGLSMTYPTAAFVVKEEAAKGKGKQLL